MSWQEFGSLTSPDSGGEDKVYGVHWNALMHHGLIKPASYIVYTYTKGATTYYAAVNGQTGKIEFGGENNAGSVNGQDADAVINACINALQNGGKILVRAGTYPINSPILIQGKNNIVLEGEGWTSTKLITSGADTICIKIGDRTNSALASNNIIIRGFYIDGSSQTTETSTPETVDRRFGIELASPDGETKGCLIEENYIYNTGSDSIYGYSTGSCIIKNNIVEGTRGYWAAIHPHSYSSEGYNLFSIIGNYIFNSSVGGIRHGIVIANNNVYNCGLAGAANGREASIMGARFATIIGNYIRCDKYNVVGIRSFDEFNVIVGNKVRMSNSVNIRVDREAASIGGHVVVGNQFWIGYNSAVIEDVNGVVFSGNSLYTPGRNGIILSGAQRCTVSNNIIYGAGILANNTYDAIILQTYGTRYSTRNIIKGNNIWSGETNLPRYGINEANTSQDYNIIANNIVTNCATAAINKQGANSILDNNIEET